MTHRTSHAGSGRLAAWTTTVLVAASLTLIGTSAHADSGPVQMPGTNHWYASVSASLTWDQANAQAQSMTFNGMTGHLVTITSAAEDSWIATQFPPFPSGVFWIGARDVGQTANGVRTWQWAAGPEAGTTFTVCSQAWWADNCSAFNGAYTSWHSVQWQQPDGRGTDTAAIFANRDNSGWWYDGIPSNPNDANGFLVEFESGGPAGPSGSTLVQMPGTNHWYTFVPSSQSWQTAFDDAHQLTYAGMQGHLVTITSAAEQDFIFALSGSKVSWIGALDLGANGNAARNWGWADGPERGIVFTTCAATFGGTCQNVDGNFSNWDSNWAQPDGLPETAAEIGYGGVERWGDCLRYSNNCGVSGYTVEFEPGIPDSPVNVTAAASDSSAIVTWTSPVHTGGPNPTYTVTSNPDSRTCTSASTSCTVNGLTNRTRYTFTVTASNEAGTSQTSTASTPVMPLAPGFQMWPDHQVLAVGGSTDVEFANSAPSTAIAFTGGTKATVLADGDGRGSTTYSATKAGVVRFSAAYSIKAGKKTTKYSAMTQLYVPLVSGPMLKIRPGKAGKFSMQLMPPGAPVTLSLSDGRTLSLTADASGKASASLVFNTRGAVSYTVTIAGVHVADGGLTIG